MKIEQKRCKQKKIKETKKPKMKKLFFTHVYADVDAYVTVAVTPMMLWPILTGTMEEKSSRVYDSDAARTVYVQFSYHCRFGIVVCCLRLAATLHSI